MWYPTESTFATASDSATGNDSRLRPRPKPVFLVLTGEWNRTNKRWFASRTQLTATPVMSTADGPAENVSTTLPALGENHTAQFRAGGKSYFERIAFGSAGHRAHHGQFLTPIVDRR